MLTSPLPGPGRNVLALAALAAASGCASFAPGHWVNGRTAPPDAVATEARNAPPPAPARPATPPAPQSPPAPPATPRSLGELVDVALSGNPATRATWHDARTAAAQAGGARSLYLPSLDVNAGISRQRTVSLPDRPGLDYAVWGPSASLTWVLLDLGARSALVDQADLTLAAARLAELAAVADLVLNVQQAYFQYLAARALLEAEAASVKQAETSLAAAEGRRRAGLATVADVLQARTALSQTRLALQQVEGQALVSRGALATLAGLAPTTELDVGQLPEAVDAAAAQPTIDELLAAAAQRNPDLGRARAAAAAAAAQARAASAALGPVLSFQSTLSRSWYEDPPSASSAWTFGLVLRIPTVHGLRPAYDALAAREQADAARDRADAAGQRVALDVWTAWQGLRTAGLRVATARDLVDSARASADVATGRYKEGVGSILDLLTAQAALELAVAEDVRARTDYLVGLAQLARATGRLDPGPRTP